MTRKRSTQGLTPFSHSKAPPPPEMEGPLVLIVASEDENSLASKLRAYAVEELERYLGAEVVDSVGLEGRVPRLIFVPGPGMTTLRKMRHDYPVSAVIFFGDLLPGDIPEAVNAGANSLLPLQSLNSHMVYLSAVEAMQRAEVYHASVDIRGTELVFSSKKMGTPEVIGLATASRALVKYVDAVLLQGEEPDVQSLARLEALKAAVRLAVEKVDEGKVDLQVEAKRHLRDVSTLDRSPTLDEARHTIRATALFKATDLG